MFQPRVEPVTDVEAPSLLICVRGADVLVRPTESGAALVEAADPEALPVAAASRQFLGLLDGRPCWSVDVAPDAGPPADGDFMPLRLLHGQLDDELWTLAGRAVQIVEWERTHRFCGRCGEPTEVVPTERARRCPACGMMAFPRLTPAVIMAVHRDDQILLAANATFRGSMYSVLAGFVEPGEPLEEAVRREVEEEVGLAVEDVTYFGSQPWPFPGQIMIGFTAAWAGGEIDVDGVELVDAQWFRADQLPRIPGPMSIARRLIDDFVARQGSR